MNYREFITPLHTATKRNYQKRIADNKAQCAKIAKKFGKEYWDGERKYGYGGYHYDGRWKKVAQKIIKTYNLNNNSTLLDIGCGKGYLLFELVQIIPQLNIHGIDISHYALENAKAEIKPYIQYGNAKKLPFADKKFDLVISNSTLHNLFLYDLFTALKEIERVKKTDANSWICIESYRNEVEKENLLNWQLTCECFFTPQEWKWILQQCKYTGDYEFIFFE